MKFMQTGEIGKGIAQRRKQLGLSQEELAGKICVTRQAVSKWESGAALPSVDNIVELARVLEISVDELLQLTVREKEAGLTAQGVGRLLDEQSARQEQRLKRLTRLLTAACAVLLAGVVLSAVLNAVQTQRMQRSMDERIGQMGSRMESRMSSVEMNVGSIVRNMLDEGEALLTDGGCRSMEYVYESRTVLMRMYAYPKTLTEQGTAEFYAVLEDGTRISVPAERVSAGFEAEISLPAGPGEYLPVSVYVTWQAADGQATERLFEESIYMTDLRMSVGCHFAALHYAMGNTVVMPSVEIGIPYNQPGKYPVHVRYEVYAGDELVGSAERELSVDPNSTWISDIPEEEIRMEGEIPFEALRLRAVVTDAGGREFTAECVPADEWPEADMNARKIVQ